MVNFKPLASSSSGNAYVLECEGHPSILIDCGIPYPKLQVALDFKLSEIGACLISHAHGDHCLAAKKLVDAGVECYASVETWEAIYGEDAFTVGTHFLDTMNTFNISGWKVRCFDAVHDMPGTYGFLIQSPEGDNCLYLTDSQYSKHKFENLHYLFVEANFSLDILKERARKSNSASKRYSRVQKTHMSIQSLEKLLAANDLSQVREIHLMHLSSTNSNEMEFIERIERQTGIPVKVCQQFSEEVIG